MPVLNKGHHLRLINELNSRFAILDQAFTGRELRDSNEGVKGRGSWVNPDDKCATTDGALGLRLAIDDFKNILAEIRKLK